MATKNQATKLHPCIVNNMNFAKPIFVTSKDDKKDESKHTYLRLVSWNVNMEAISAYAPNEWHRHNNKWDEVYEQVESQNADIITYQEIPTPYDNNNNYYKPHPLIQKYIDSGNWYITNSTASHCGHTLILIHKRVENQYGFEINYDDNIDPLGKWPAVILRKKIIKNIDGTENNEEKINNEKIEYDDNQKLMLFGVHLMYGDHGANARLSSFDRLYKLSQKKNMQNNFILIGDTNMRENEEKIILNKYDVSSCWNFINPQYLKLNNFMATFYRNFFKIGKQGTTRYDKIFYGKHLRFISFGIFDKTVSPNNHFHFLSDHRGIFADIEI